MQYITSNKKNTRLHKITCRTSPNSGVFRYVTNVGQRISAHIQGAEQRLRYRHTARKSFVYILLPPTLVSYTDHVAAIHNIDLRCFVHIRGNYWDKRFNRYFCKSAQSSACQKCRGLEESEPQFGPVPSFCKMRTPTCTFLEQLFRRTECFYRNSCSRQKIGCVM